jgi:hypothetical protein
MSGSRVNGVLSRKNQLYVGGPVNAMVSLWGAAAFPQAFYF